MANLAASFFAAADVATAVIESPEVAAAWQAPSVLAGYTVAGVAGHLLAATARLETILDDDEPKDASPVDLGAFYGANFLAGAAPETGLHRYLRVQGEQLAEAGPHGIAVGLAELVGRLRDRLRQADADRLVSVVNVPGGATPLRTYLRSRIVELVVHTDDLAASIGREIRLAAPVAAIVIDVLVELARSRHGDLAVIRAFARSERAEPDATRVF